MAGCCPFPGGLRSHQDFRREVANDSWVRIGTLLTQLERLRGRVLSFSGFGWDYGGATAWTEGTGTIGLRLDVLPADYSKIQDPRTDDIFGDREVRSDHPVIRQLRVRLEEILRRWGPHATEDSCG